jgi:tRNA pseudouridine(38-40) synthase
MGSGLTNLTANLTSSWGFYIILDARDNTSFFFQVAHFTTPFPYHCLDNIHSAINGLLPKEIRVREISAARPEFHARTSTKSKIYHYKIYNEAIMDPFQNRYAFHSAYKLNPHAMREAAKHFVGTHDFTSFANAAHNDRVRSPIKKIIRFDVTEMVIDDWTKNCFSYYYLKVCCLEFFSLYRGCHSVSCWFTW